MFPDGKDLRLCPNDMISRIADIKGVFLQTPVEEEGTSGNSTILFHETIAQDGATGPQGDKLFHDRIDIVVTSDTATLIDQKIIAIRSPAEDRSQGMDKEKYVR